MRLPGFNAPAALATGGRFRANGGPGQAGLHNAIVPQQSGEGVGDFRACYKGCRAFGGGAISCALVCAPVIVR